MLFPTSRLFCPSLTTWTLPFSMVFQRRYLYTSCCLCGFGLNPLSGCLRLLQLKDRCEEFDCSLACSCLFRLGHIRVVSNCRFGGKHHSGSEARCLGHVAQRLLCQAWDVVTDPEQIRVHCFLLIVRLLANLYHRDKHA